MDNEPDTKTLIKLDLSSALSEARNGKEGLSINQIAGILSEHFDVSELRSLISSLHGILDVADTKRKPIGNNFPENHDYPSNNDKALE